MKMLLITLVVVGEGREIESKVTEVISYEDKLWIVPEWIVEPRTAARRPARIILLDTLDHQRFDPPYLGHDLALHANIPKALYYGHAQPPEGSSFVVIENPSIRLPGVRP